MRDLLDVCIRIYKLSVFFQNPYLHLNIFNICIRTFKENATFAFTSANIHIFIQNIRIRISINNFQHPHLHFLSKCSTSIHIQKYLHFYPKICIRKHPHLYLYPQFISKIHICICIYNFPKSASTFFE